MNWYQVAWLCLFAPLGPYAAWCWHRSRVVMHQMDALSNVLVAVLTCADNATNTDPAAAHVFRKAGFIILAEQQKLASTWRPLPRAKKAT